MYCQKIVESTDVETHLSIKLRGILRPKSVRRTLVMGLIYGPRANKQFDGQALEALRQLNFYAQMTVLTIFMLMQMPGPRDIVIYWPGLRAFSVVQKPGAGHTFGAKAPGCPGGW